MAACFDITNADPQEAVTDCANFIRIATDFDVEALRLSLVEQPELFGMHASRAEQYASPHSAMTDIWVRYNHIDELKNGPAAFNGEHDSVWYPVIEKIPALIPIVFRLMALVSGERLGGILITKLPPDGVIASHVDGGWHAGYYSKFYVPIQNEPGSVFGFPEGEIHGRCGEVYEFDNSVPHWVRNDSNSDRLSLIICIKTHAEAVREYC